MTEDLPDKATGGTQDTGHPTDVWLWPDRKPMTTINDATIASAMRRNAEDGFRMLMKKYKVPVYWHTRRLLVSHDDAQDATQETLIRGSAPSTGSKATARSAHGYTASPPTKSCAYWSNGAGRAHA